METWKAMEEREIYLNKGNCRSIIRGLSKCGYTKENEPHTANGVDNGQGRREEATPEDEDRLHAGASIEIRAGDREASGSRDERRQVQLLARNPRVSPGNAG